MHLGVYCYLLHSSALYLKFPFQVHPMHGFCYNVCSRWANLACGNGTFHILLALTVSKTFSWIEMPNWRIQQRRHRFALFKISSQIWQILLISSIKLSLFWQTKFDTQARRVARPLLCKSGKAIERLMVFVNSLQRRTVNSGWFDPSKKFLSQSGLVIGLKYNQMLETCWITRFEAKLRVLKPSMPSILVSDRSTTCHPVASVILHSEHQSVRQIKNAPDAHVAFV